MDRDALSVLPPPPNGPARIAPAPGGFLARRPGAGTLARDAAVVGLVVLAVVATLAGIVTLLTRGFSGLVCLLFVSPAIVASIALPPTRRLIYAARGARTLRVTPSELLIEHAGVAGVQRIPLASIRGARSAAMGEVIVDASGDQRMIEFAANEPQTRWLVSAIAIAAELARRTPWPPAPPTARGPLRAR